MISSSSSSMTADLHTDTRLVERRLAKGFMSRAEADKLVADLPDVAEKGEWVSVDLQNEDGEDDADSDED